MEFSLENCEDHAQIITVSFFFLVKERNVTWASDYSLLFLDNPVGAGFSFTDDDRGYPNNEDDVSTMIIIDVILNTFFEE